MSSIVEAEILLLVLKYSHFMKHIFALILKALLQHLLDQSRILPLFQETLHSHFFPILDQKRTTFSSPS